MARTGLRLPFDGDRLRELRERRGLMQRELAELVEVDPSRISQLEQGTGGTRPMPGLLRKLAEALGVEIDALLKVEPNGRPNPEIDQESA